MVDIAHIAGLVATGEHPSPVPHADFVTSTTHKTLRGPRSGMIMCREALLVHVIAAKAICFKEAASDEFRVHIRQVVRNAQALAATIARRGFRVVSGGTDNHLMLVDVFSKGINGRQAEQSLDKAGITVSRSTLPFDPNPPLRPSGVRIGTPSVTTRGMREKEMDDIGNWIADVLENHEDADVHRRVKSSIEALCEKFPLYPNRSR
jgi:glycine hydroxymethyltransferase